MNRTLIGYALAADSEWRWMLGLGGVPGIVLAIGVLILPETPLWLAGDGNTDQARAALLRLRGPGVDVKAGMARLRNGLTTKAEARPENHLGYATARLLPMIVGIGLAVFQQVTGSLTAYIGCFAIGLGPVVWLLISEIFPMAIRARGISAATIAAWLAKTE